MTSMAIFSLKIITNVANIITAITVIRNNPQTLLEIMLGNISINLKEKLQLAGTVVRDPAVDSWRPDIAL